MRVCCRKAVRSSSFLPQVIAVDALISLFKKAFSVLRASACRRLAVVGLE
jgi:hypothetical protein